MSTRGDPVARYALPLYVGASVLMGLACTLGADVLAMVFVEGRGVLDALSDHLRYRSYWNPFFLPFNLFQISPFIVVGLLSGNAAGTGLLRSLWVFLVGAVPLCILYFIAHYAAYEALRDHRPTAGTLGLAFLPIRAIPAILPSCAVWIFFESRGSPPRK